MRIGIDVRIHGGFNAALQAMEDRIMATLQEVKDAIASVGTKVDDAASALAAEIARVEALITAGTPVTPQDLQDLVDSLQGVASKVDAIKSTADSERP